MTFARFWKHRTVFLVAFLFLLGAFLRLYRLPNTMQFLGDQGRDAIIARNILINHHPALIGPVTSVGNMYLGPFYYYFMVIPLMMSYPSPTGPAFAVALVGILTLVLVYVLGKRMLGEKAALIALALYAVSPVIIANVRFSWNPNIVPLFSLLMVWFLYKILRGSERAWIWVGITFSILMQLHYITLILAMLAFCIWCGNVFQMIRSKKWSWEFVRSTLVAIGIFLASLFPLVVFDVRHQGTNLKAFEAFFKGNGQHFRFFTALSAVFFQSIGLSLRLLFQLFTVTIHGPIGFVFAALVAILLFLCVKKWEKGDAYAPGRRLIVGTFVFSILILSLYRESIFDHYLAFLFPIVCLLIGMIGALFWRKAILRPLVVLIVVIAVALSLSDTPAKHYLGYNIDMMKRTADAILSRVQPGQTYDILLFADTNDYQGMNYRYFLETSPNSPATEEQVHEFKTLFIIDEQHKKNPVDGPQYKIAMWPNRTIIDDFTVLGGPRVVELKR